MTWYTITSPNGSEMGRYRTLLRAVEARQELVARFGLPESDFTIRHPEPIDPQDVEVAVAVLQRPHTWAVRNYFRSVELGRFPSREQAERHYESLIGAERINSGVEVVL